MYKSNNVNWYYSEQTGTVPFIINNDENRIKLILEDEILPIQDAEDSTYFDQKLKRTIQNHFKDNCNGYILETAEIVSRNLNMLEFVVFFGSQNVCSDKSTLRKSQVYLIKKAYDKKMKSAHKKALRKQEKQKRIQEQCEREHEF